MNEKSDPELSTAPIADAFLHKAQDERGQRLSDAEIDAAQEATDCFLCDCCDPRMHDFAREIERRALAASGAKPAIQGEPAINALRRLERAVDLHLGRSAWTQTQNLKGLGYSEQVRKELFAAHDEARAALSGSAQGKGGER